MFRPSWSRLDWRKFNYYNYSFYVIPINQLHRKSAHLKASPCPLHLHTNPRHSTMVRRKETTKSLSGAALHYKWDAVRLRDFRPPSIH